MANTYAPSTDRGAVRLLLNDVSAPWIFSDDEIDAFLRIERDSLKRAAAQAIDTNASNEVLASKVLKSQDVATDGAKAADALRKHAAELRRQADVEDDEGGFFEVVDFGCDGAPELAEWPLP